MPLACPKERVFDACSDTQVLTLSLRISEHKSRFRKLPMPLGNGERHYSRRSFVTKKHLGAFVTQRINTAVCTVIVILGAISKSYAATLGPKLIELQRDEVWKYDDLTLDNLSIVTNGHRLEIQVSGDLKIIGKAKILSHETNVVSETPGQASAGVGGTPSFNPGPNSSGASPGARGRNGGPGGIGAAGSPGSNGAPSKPVIVRVKGSATGFLAIENHGENGGAGGQGGSGGSGGNGEQGGIALSNKIKVLGRTISAGCARGPGSGGNGGAGGAAGAGGPGGDGGNGGEIRVIVEGSVRQLTLTTGLKQQFFVMASSLGGRAGIGAAPGPPGKGGIAGYGGRGASGCEGRVAERRGVDGADGQQGANGAPGRNGIPGDIHASPKFILVSKFPAEIGK